MKSTRSFILETAKRFSAMMLVFAFLPFAFAQEIMNEQGEPIPMSPKAEYVPNEIIVNFAPETITLPAGRILADIADITMHPQVAALIRDAGARQVKKVFRFFVRKDTIRTLESGKKVRVQDLSQVFVLRFPAAIDVPALANRFKNSPRVIHAQPNYIYHIEINPNDPRFPNQWGLEQTSDEDIDVTTAWNYEKGSYSIKIGIFDTGLDYGHDDLGNAFGLGWKVVGGWDWINNDSDPIDDHFHGTHVAGIAGALTNNRDGGQIAGGVAGVAGGWDYERSTNSGNKGAQFFSMKIANANGSVNSADAADAIVEGADPDGDGWGYGIHVLNNSWGGYSYDENLRSAVNYAARMNRVFVAAKGNDDTNDDHYPSDYDGGWVISVGATNPDGDRARYPDWGWTNPWNGSNTGNGIDVVAPGTAIVATTPTFSTSAMNANNVSTNFDSLSGTSMATPHVSGLAALILSQDPTLHPEDVQGIIRASADDKPPTGYDDEYGAGRINAGRALQYMQSPWTLNQWTASGGSSVGNTGTYQATFYNTGGGLASGAYIVKRYDVRKTVSFSQQFSGTPYVWGRGVNATVGWSAANPNYQVGYCNVVSSTATSAQLQTFVYEVWTSGGSYKGWYPTSPSNVTFAYTVLGLVEPLSVYISGPGTLGWKERGTWTANPSGGSGSYTYEWRYRYNGTGSWSGVVGTSQQYSATMLDTDFELQVKVTSGSEQAYDTHYVYYEGDILPKHAGDMTVLIPEQFLLEQNYPNPFNPSTEIKYALPEAGHITLSIFNIVGQRVRTLVDEQKPAGYYNALWDSKDAFGNEVASGVYLYRISVRPDNADSKPFESLKKMTLLR